jgi:hypothetical protein
MSRLAIMVTWNEVTGSDPSLEDLHERLKGYGLSSVLIGLSRITALLQTWQNQGNLATDRALAEKYLPSYFSRIRPLYTAGNDRFVFARMSILFVASHACVVCEVNGEEVHTAEDVERILSCCLITNDLLLERRPRDTDTPLDNAANLLPFADYVPQDSFPNELARGLLLFEEISPRVERRDFIDLASAFRDVTGLEPRSFCELVFASSIKFITHVNEQLREPSGSLILTPESFRHTAIPREQVVEFLKRLAINLERLHATATRAARLGSDCLIFQKYPLIEFAADSFLCIDPGFLLDKAGRSLYWTLHERHPRNLQGYWGAVIECYVQYLFRETYKGRGQVLYSPQFTNGDQACDIALLEGSTLLVLEVKASVLTVRAKYAFDPVRLKQELDLKAIKGEDGERKGVAQLWAGTTRFLGGDNITGLDRSAVRTIYPILVFLDDSFTAPYLNAVYNDHFDRQEIRHRYRVRVTPLFSVTVQDLENVLPQTDRHWLCDILESYWRANRKMYGRLSHSSVPLLFGEPPGRSVVRDRFSAFGDDMQRRLFPNGGMDRPVDM